MKYWAYVNNEILGPFEKEKLLELPAFAPSLLICPQTPVGEKTEDWKEASSYPEISAVIGAGTMHASPAIDPRPAQESQAARHTTDRKSLTAATIDPIPPKESSVGGINLPVGHLERSGRVSMTSATATEQSPSQSGASFDPLTLSGINKRAAGPAPEGIMGEPRTSFGTAPVQAAPIPGLEQSAAPAFGGIEPGFSSAISPEPASSSPAQVQQAFTAPAQQAFAAPVQQQAFAVKADPAAMSDMGNKLDMVLRNAASKQDIAMAMDPLKVKLEQMGEVLANIKNSQFQHEIIDKLAYLENAISDLKSLANAKAAQAEARPAQGSNDLKMVGISETFFSSPAPVAAKVEKKKAAPPPDAGKKTEIIVDQGNTKFSIGAVFHKIGALIKKLLMFIFTLVLLAAVAFVAAVLLKNAGVFDASKFIPFTVPFLSSPAPAAEAAPQTAAGAQAFAKPQPAPAEAQPAEKKPVDISPEVIYFARYYKTSETGPKLEDTISAIAAKTRGKYDASAWQAQNTAPDVYDVTIAVPSRTGSVSYTYTVDYAKKTLEPKDEAGKAAFDALTPKAPSARKGRRGKKAAAAPAADTAAPASDQDAVLPPGTPPGVKAPAKGAAGKGKGKGKSSVKAAESEDAYEYVYEEE